MCHTFNAFKRARVGAQVRVSLRYYDFSSFSRGAFPARLPHFPAEKQRPRARGDEIFDVRGHRVIPAKFIAGYLTPFFPPIRARDRFEARLRGIERVARNGWQEWTGGIALK